MQLSKWLERMPRGEAGRLAKAVDITESQISRYRSGQHRPSPDVAAAISEATGGAVSIIEQLYPDGVPPGATVVPPEWLPDGVEITPTGETHASRDHKIRLALSLAGDIRDIIKQLQRVEQKVTL